MNKIEKMAAADAYEFGLAQMFFGEGAGTRRKLIEAKIDHNVSNIPGYEAAIDKAYSKLKQIDMAEKAIAERKRIDRAAKAGKNFRALKSGNVAGLSNGVFLVVGLAYVAHVTGYDKVVIEKSKTLYRRAKAQFQGDSNIASIYNVYNFTQKPTEEK